MRINTNCKIRNIAGENVIIFQDSQGCDLTRILRLNSTSMLLWDSFKGKDFCIEDATNLLCATFEVEIDTARRDVEKWIDKLKSFNLILE